MCQREKERRADLSREERKKERKKEGKSALILRDKQLCVLLTSHIIR